MRGGECASKRHADRAARNYRPLTSAEHSRWPKAGRGRPPTGKTVAVGIYSVLAYVVGQRRREIGVRLALGARPGHVINTVLWHALLLTGTGVGIGSLAAWILTRTLASHFQGVRPHDPRILVGVILAFGAIAFAAAMIPALRTTQVDPVLALSST